VTSPQVRKEVKETSKKGKVCSMVVVMNYSRCPSQVSEAVCCPLPEGRTRVSAALGAFPQDDIWYHCWPAGTATSPASVGTLTVPHEQPA
jgi:hypothetical protein